MADWNVLPQNCITVLIDSLTDCKGAHTTATVGGDVRYLFSDGSGAVWRMYVVVERGRDSVVGGLGSGWKIEEP